MENSPTATDRRYAWTCVLINQFATPGLGSLLARRFIAGSGQLLLSVAGFTLLVGWMCRYFYRMIEQMSRSLPPTSMGWMAKWGAILFGASWVWSLFTSISVLRKSKPGPTPSIERVPPRYE